MTQLLQQAIAAINKLPPETQDAIAARLLAEVADEEGWRQRFEATTPDQWKRMAAKARRAIAEGNTTPLEDVLPPERRA